MKEKFPIEYLRGILKIYETGAGDLVKYKVRWLTPHGKDHCFRSELKEAKKLANQIKGKVRQGNTDILVLSPAEQLDYQFAVDTLKESGTDIRTVAKEYAESYKLLKGPHMLEAVRYFARRNIHTLPKMSVQNAVKGFLNSIDRPVCLKLQTAYLRRFSEAFQMDLKQVRSKDIDAFLRALPLAERSKMNTRSAIKALMIYAASQGWIPKDDDTMDSVRKFRDAQTEVAILTPDELAAILTYAREEIIPWIAFRAFSTIRDSELKILDWEQVKPKSIRITKGKGLVPTRRLIPIAPNLKEWIEPFRLKSGQVSPFANSYKQFKKACDAAGVKYSRNCLRHSAITYRVMLTGNVERIALESGNSAAKIHSNYL